MLIQIGDTMYTLEYRVNSVCTLEEFSGLSLEGIVKLPTFTSLRWLLWCGLIAHYPALTTEAVGDLMGIYFKSMAKEDLLTTIEGAIIEAGFLKAQSPTTKNPKIQKI